MQQSEQEDQKLLTQELVDTCEQLGWELAKLRADNRKLRKLNMDLIEELRKRNRDAQ